MGSQGKNWSPSTETRKEGRGGRDFYFCFLLLLFFFLFLNGGRGGVGGGGLSRFTFTLLRHFDSWGTRERTGHHRCRPGRKGGGEVEVGFYSFLLLLLTYFFMVVEVGVGVGMGVSLMGNQGKNWSPSTQTRKKERGAGKFTPVFLFFLFSFFLWGRGGVEGGGLPLPSVCSDYLIRGEPGKELFTIDADHKERARGR